MAEPEFRISEVSLSSLADSTSALAEMMVASEIRFWMAADCKFLCTSFERMTSA